MKDALRRCNVAAIVDGYALTRQVITVPPFRMVVAARVVLYVYV